MTDEERWATEQRPDSVLYAVERTNRQLLTNRKVRLFACGCFRLIWERVKLPSIHRLVELAEARADRLVKQSELENIHFAEDIHFAEGDPPRDSPDHLLGLYIGSLLRATVVPGYFAHLTRAAVDPARYQYNNSRWQECPEQARLARCVFGNPFHPVTCSPSWRTETALVLAREMYEAREFSAMPILADALQDAGCDNEDVLTHCRDGSQVHARGCWVVDLVLERI
jgi:hypothetical protein